MTKTFDGWCGRVGAPLAPYSASPLPHLPLSSPPNLPSI